MKSKLGVVAALVLILFVAATINRPPEKVDVFTALQKKWIEVKAISNGLNSEECASLNIRNLSGKLLQVSMPAGTVLNSSDNAYQDILVTKPEDVFVDAGKTVTENAYGFCCQASNGIAGEGEGFSVEKCSNEKLLKLSEHLALNKYDPELEQSAIWAVSDQHSVGGIYNDNKPQCEKLRKFTADLLGQKVPFYDVDYGYELNTPFVYEPKTLEGNMSYALNESGRASLKIYAPDGSLFQTFYENKYMQSAFFTQHFRYTATDMMAGEYKVKLTVNGKLISEQSIVL